MFLCSARCEAITREVESDALPTKIAGVAFSSQDARTFRRSASNIAFKLPLPRRRTETKLSRIHCQFADRRGAPTRGLKLMDTHQHRLKNLRPSSPFLYLCASV